MFEEATSRQRRLLLEMSDLSGAEHPVDMASVVQSSLLELVPGDLALLNDVHLTRSTGVVEPVTQFVRDEDVPALKLLLDEHPAVSEYKSMGGRLFPRRTTDLVDPRTFVRSRIYRETLQPLGSRFQLTIPVPMAGGVYTQAWSINRSTHDFSDAEVALSASLQPLLGLLGPVYFQSNSMATSRRRGSVSGENPKSVDVRPSAAGVTRREGEILRCIARGWTADRSANHLGISPLTVRTHLRNAYAKLGVSDRLLAVERARRLGII